MSGRKLNRVRNDKKFMEMIKFKDIS
jgi:hypothetical protein